jgi:predicted type IV restriction endonuclease
MMTRHWRTLIIMMGNWRTLKMMIGHLENTTNDDLTLEKTNNNDGHWRTLKMMIGHLENTKLQFFELVGQFYTTAIPHFASIFHDRSNK